MNFYRTHRPQHFSDLIGQDAICTILQRALLLERVSHAYLFSGPRGTGKTSTARIFARAIVCLKPQLDQKKSHYEPCNECANCQAILQQHTTDLVEIDAASNRGIEDIRELREQVRYHPTLLPRKIYIIDEVHMLTTEAFNALLKTLEEPPAYCIFILATTELSKVPITIRSRCQLLRFERGSLEALQKKLDYIIKSEGLTVEAGVTGLIAEHADGGYRDAETLLETLSTMQADLKVAAVEQQLGLLPQATAEALLDACLTQNITEVQPLLRKIFSIISASPERFLTQLIKATRKRALSSKQNSPLLTYALGEFMTAFILQRSAPLPTLPMEIACLNIANYNQEEYMYRPSIQAEKEGNPEEHVQLPAIQNSVHITSTVDNKPLPTPIVPVVELRQESVRDIRRAWKMMIEKIGQSNMVLAQALKQTHFHTAENNRITVHVPYKFHADKLNEKKILSSVTTILEDLTDQVWQVEYVVNSTLPKEKPLKKLESQEEDARAVFAEK